MTRYSCESTVEACRRAVEAAAKNTEVSLGDWGNTGVRLVMPFTGMWATVTLHPTSREQGGCDLHVSVRPNLGFRVLIQLVIAFMCGVCVWLLTGRGLSNTFAVIAGVLFIVFAVCVLLLGAICTRHMASLMTALSTRVDGLVQASPNWVELHWYEFALMGLWLAGVVFSAVFLWGGLLGILVVVLVAGAIPELPMVNRSKSSFRISQHLLESYLTFACAMFIAASVLVSMPGLMNSMHANDDGEGPIHDMAYVSQNILWFEWNREESHGLDAKQYAQRLSGHFSDSALRIRRVKTTLIAVVFVMGAGFWSLRKSISVGRSLVQIQSPATPDKPMPGTFEDIGWHTKLVMSMQCIVAGVFRWGYVLLSLEITLVLWLGKSVVVSPLDWAVIFNLEMLAVSDSYASAWRLAGFCTFQILAIPGLLLLAVTMIRLGKFLWQDLSMPLRCNRDVWQHPGVELALELAKKDLSTVRVSVIADPKCRQISVARVSLLTRRLVIAVDPVRCGRLDAERVAALLLHECRHLQGHAQQLTWQELGSLLLLAPHNSLQVFHDFYRAELEADRYACQALRDPSPLLGVLQYVETSRAFRRRKSNAPPRAASLLKSSLGWARPVFLHDTIWTAAYPSIGERKKRVQGTQDNYKET